MYSITTAHTGWINESEKAVNTLILSHIPKPDPQWILQYQGISSSGATKCHILTYRGVQFKKKNYFAALSQI